MEMTMTQPEVKIIDRDKSLNIDCIAKEIQLKYREYSEEIKKQIELILTLSNDSELTKTVNSKLLALEKSENPFNPYLGLLTYISNNLKIESIELFEAMQSLFNSLSKIFLWTFDQLPEKECIELMKTPEVKTLFLQLSS